MKSNNKEPQTVECEEMNIILKIPKGCASVSVAAVMIDENDNTYKVEKRLNAEDIRTARQDFLDYVEGGDDYDTAYVLTEEGKRYAESLR